LNIEAELDRLAHERDDAYGVALAAMDLDAASQLRQLRAYLARQQDHRRIKGTMDKIIQLRQLPDGLNELDCARAEFVSESRLEFTIRMEQRQPGWRISQFRFHLHLPSPREVTMVRIHLNAQQGRDCLGVPRCHMHIGRGRKHGKAHIPFPVLSPLLVLHLICEVIEPDFGE
jgi:hypothetical protein